LALGIPIQLQLLEADHLDHMYSTPRSTTENYVIQGVEYAPSGKRVAYYIFPFHLAEGGVIRTRIPAEDVIHLFRPRRIGQVRGLPSGTSGHVRMRDLDEFEDAELLKQKVSACFAAFVQDSSDSIVQGPANAEADLDRIEPGTIETLPTGKSMVFSNPPVTNGQGEFVKTKLRSIASSYGITYESMTSDYSNVNLNVNPTRSDGFKQAVVIITPQAGQNITNLQLINFTPPISGTYTLPVEEIYISAPNLTNLAIGTATTSTIYCRNCSYVNLINSGTITNFSNLFQNIYRGREINAQKHLFIFPSTL